MTFFKQAFMLVVYVYFVPFVAIERQLKALFCIFFPNTSSNHNLIYTKFCILFFGYVYVIGKKNQLNMNI